MSQPNPLFQRDNNERLADLEARREESEKRLVNVEGKLDGLKETVDQGFATIKTTLETMKESKSSFINSFVYPVLSIVGASVLVWVISAFKQ